MTIEERINELERELFILKHTRVCEVCGKEFLAGTKFKKYCSAACNRKAYRARLFTDEIIEKRVNKFADKISEISEERYKENYEDMIRATENIINVYKNRSTEW